MLNFSNSQTIFWEKEYKFDFHLSSSTNPVILDSHGDIVNIIEGTTGYSSNSNFFKCDLMGNLTIPKTIFNLEMTLKTGLRIPMIFYETQKGYRIFAATNSNFALTDPKHLLPIVINTENTGDTTNVHYPYDQNINDNYSNFGIVKSDNISNTVTINNKFYNVSVNQWVKISKNESVENYHIIVGCYDSTGVIFGEKALILWE